METRNDIIFRVVTLYTVDYSRRTPVLSFIAPFVTKYGEPKSTHDRQWLTYDWKDTATSLRISIESDKADATSLKSYRATYDDLAMTRALEAEKRNLRLHDSSYEPQKP